MDIFLSYPVAERARVLPANASTNDAYVKLPTLASVRGTLGDPKPDIKETAIVGLVARSGGGLLGNTGDAGKILQGIGGFLSGDRNTNRAAANTNAPSGSTNTPTATTNAPAQKNPLGGLLDLIPKKKK